MKFGGVVGNEKVEVGELIIAEVVRIGKELGYRVVFEFGTF